MRGWSGAGGPHRVTLPGDLQLRMPQVNHT